MGSLGLAALCHVEGKEDVASQASLCLERELTPEGEELQVNFKKVWRLGWSGGDR